MAPSNSRQRDVTCPACRAGFAQALKRSAPFGFPRFACPECGRRFSYPLTSGYRAAYWVVGALFAYAASSLLIMVLAAAKRELRLPGDFGYLATIVIVVLVACVVALVSDRRVRREVKAATGPQDREPGS